MGGRTAADEKPAGGARGRVGGGAKRQALQTGKPGAWHGTANRQSKPKESKGARARGRGGRGGHTGRPPPAGATLLMTALKAGRSSTFLRKGMRLQRGGGNGSNEEGRGECAGFSKQQWQHQLQLHPRRQAAAAVHATMQAQAPPPRQPSPPAQRASGAGPRAPQEGQHRGEEGAEQQPEAPHLQPKACVCCKRGVAMVGRAGDSGERAGGAPAWMHRSEATARHAVAERAPPSSRQRNARRTTPPPPPAAAPSHSPTKVHPHTTRITPPKKKAEPL